MFRTVPLRGSRFGRMVMALGHAFTRYEKPLAVVLVALSLVAGVATYFAFSAAPPWGQDPESISWLLSIDLVVLILLSTLVVQRVVGLYLSRRRGHGASRLHIRMVAMFSALATAPAILLVLFSLFFFEMGVQSWFSHQVKTAVTEASAVAQAYLDEHRNVIKADLSAMATDIDRQASLIYADPSDLNRFLDTQSFLRNFSVAALFNASGRVLGQGGIGLGFDPTSLPVGAIQNANFGDPVVFTDGDNVEKIQALVRLANFDNTYLYVARSADPTVLSYLAATKDASSSYLALEHKRAGLQFQFFAIYIIVALLLIMASVWGGLYLAGELVGPIEGLIDAAEQVQGGNLRTRVPEQQGLDEFDDLARTFNRMTRELEQQRGDLIAANHQLNERRRFTETVLAGVSSGVMAIDADGVVRLANGPAAKILGMKIENLFGSRVSAVLPELDVNAPSDAPHEMKYTRRDLQHRTLLMRVARDVTPVDGEGIILTFDDITDLQSAQRKSAWADVARRVAHEIKNPLTPIQLSAERLRRKFLKEIPEAEQGVFIQCIETIIRHVGDIGRMAGEFASFARMPEPTMKMDDMGDLVRDIVSLHQANKADGVAVVLGGDLLDRSLRVPLYMDGGQMRQAVTNLILNASESVVARIAKDPEPAGQVMVYLGRQDGAYILSVLDNGLGFPAGVPTEQLSEPYVTFREKGTGLGLAIVKKIVVDHKGSMQLDGPDGIRELTQWGDQGAVVSLVLPIPLEQMTQTYENESHAA